MNAGVYHKRTMSELKANLFTSCYNLLKYCIDLKKSGSAVDNALPDQIIGIFHADWRNFIQDPYWLHDKTQNPA